MVACSTPQKVEVECKYDPSPTDFRSDAFVNLDLQTLGNQFRYCFMTESNGMLTEDDRKMCAYHLKRYQDVRAAMILVCEESAHRRNDVKDKCKEFLLMEYDLSMMIKSAKEQPIKSKQL